jgi:hypothetical protein
VKAGFNLAHWADWASQRTRELQAEGAQASFTFEKPSEVSANPAFFVDLDYASVVGRIIFWSTGDYDLTVHKQDAEEPVRISGWPECVSNENFEGVFHRFVALVRECG